MNNDVKRPQAVEELMYRMPMPVKEDKVCPRCGGKLEKEKQKFCAHCGQKIAWDTNEQ